MASLSSGEQSLFGLIMGLANRIEALEFKVMELEAKAEMEPVKQVSKSAVASVG